MRTANKNGALSVRAISGTRVVLMAWDLDSEARQGLRGFAIKHKIAGSKVTGKWLTGIKYFASQVPAPVIGAIYSSRKHPFQTFLWSDYELDADTAHKFTIVALYGAVDELEERHTVEVGISTEKENDDRNGIWFNRGAIASHAMSLQFKNKPITPAMFNKVDANGQLLDAEVRWLSRGLVEACLSFIRGTRPGEALRVCAYEFTYSPVLNALIDALKRGVDVRIIYHDTKKDNDANVKAIESAGLPEEAKLDGKTQRVLFPRTRTKIPHNKFIVKIVKGKPAAVWTGSTNFTDTGFFGQTNVGHLITDASLAQIYARYWEELSSDPTLSNAVIKAVELTPNPPNAPSATRPGAFFSPRIAENMLDWYAQRLDDASSLAMMTIPFNVSPTILKGLASSDESLRLVILEDPPTKEVLAAEKASQGRLAFSNGAILNKDFFKSKSRFGGAKVAPIPQSPLDRWFIDEELARPVNKGHVFFVHSKFLLIDPLSDDPLVCTGSANFSKNSLIANDENMLIIRGDTRVADIYLTEFDRIFRHFYARDALNRIAKDKGTKQNPLELDEGFSWVTNNLKPGSFKNNRRLMFFPDPAMTNQEAWSAAAKRDNNPFDDETARGKKNREKKRSAK
ncbi:phospholipase D-like domain-containing protein [Caballeronia sp. S22]|uniref:phospholipase D-like domain-containing protein n=1 Tax=Caballeronia sp. S22 TaxID=3137182 RepID=UPI003530FA84